MSQINVDTDQMQAMADHFERFLEDGLHTFNQFHGLYEALLDHWRGHAADQARIDLTKFAQYTEETFSLADKMRSRLLKAKQAFEQAGLDGLNSLAP